MGVPAPVTFWYGPIGVLWLIEELWEDALWMSQQLATFKKPTISELDLTPTTSPVTVRIIDASYEAGEYTVTIEARWRGYPLTPYGPYLDEPPAPVPVPMKLKHVKVEVTMTWEGGSTTATLYVKKYGSERAAARIPKPFGYAKVAVLPTYEVTKEDYEKLKIFGIAATAALAGGTAAALSAAAGSASALGLEGVAAKIKAVLTPIAAKIGALGSLEEISRKLAEYIVRIEGYPIERMDYWIRIEELVPLIKKAVAAGAIAGAAAAAATQITKAAEEEVKEKETVTAAAAGGGVVTRELIKIT
ncbi:MAG: hypothetical protein QXU69_07045 [Thermofilaceae archaeon]